MDEYLIKIANMSNEQQEKTFADLEKKLGTEITQALRERVFYIMLFTNENFYNAVVEEMGNNLYTKLSRNA